MEYIKTDQIESEKVLSVFQIDNIYERLVKYSLAGNKLKQVHVKNIKNSSSKGGLSN